MRIGQILHLPFLFRLQKGHFLFYKSNNSQLIDKKTETEKNPDVQNSNILDKQIIFLFIWLEFSIMITDKVKLATWRPTFGLDKWI